MGALTGLQVQILGPVRALRGDSELPLGGLVPRALLTRLALAHGAVVPDASLVDDVWDDSPPANALAGLQTYVSRLRRVLAAEAGAAEPGAAVLVRSGPGYALRLPAGALDADRFEDLTARAGRLLRADATDPDDATRGAELLTQALDLWRGPACADVADRPFAAGEAVRLDELRVLATEMRLAALLAAPGDHAEVAATAAALESFVRDHPLREHAWQLLATALYRQGRQADALRALRTLRSVLADELGADPSPATTELQTAILTQDPRLLPARSAPPAGPAHAGPSTPAATPAPGVSGPGDASPASTNIPAALVRTVGRENDLAAVAGLLAEHRLVTLTGAGGTGKTNLALAVARGRPDADGPWLVELAGLREGALLPEAVASAIGLTGTAGADALAAVLRSREFLLVVDNAEHLLDDLVPLLRTLLGACPGLRVLVTSREPLATEGERVHEVPPLAGPDAEALFLERASATGGGIDATDRALVGQVCRRLDGLPLAIELAAGQTRALSLPQIAELLDDRLTLLRGRCPSTPHHVTMRAAIQWSWDRLDAEEQDAFTALAVFEDGFTLEAARSVSGLPDTVGVVASLVAKSLVQAPPGRVPRYRVLETLRQFAAERGTPERARELAARHVAWVEELTAGSDPALHGRSGPLAAEAANVRAALAAADPTSALRIASRFYWYWYAEGLVGEGLGRLLPALAAADAAMASRGGPTPAEHAVLGRALLGVALLTYLTGDIGGVVDALQRAGNHAARSEDPLAQAQVLATTSYFEARSGQIAAGREHARTALALSEATGQTGTRAESLMVLGEVERADGRPGAALACLAAAVEAADTCGYTWVGMSSRWIQSKVELALGDVAAAEVSALDCLARAGAAAETTSWLVAVATLSHLRLLRERPCEAAELAGAVAWLGGRVGFSPASMDPDLESYSSALLDALPPDDFAACAQRGAGASFRDVETRVREMVLGRAVDPRTVDALP